MLRSISHAVSALALTALSLAVSAEPANNPAKGDPKAAVGQLVDQAMAVMFKPGEQDPDWNKGGADVLGSLRGKPGHALLDVDKEGERTIIFFTDKPVAGLLPADWELVTEIGQLEDAQSASLPVEIGDVDDGYYSVSRTRYERVGDAYCSSAPTGVRIYRQKGAPQAGVDQQMVTHLFRELLERSKSLTVCERFEASEDGHRPSYFLPDGRALPFFNEKSGVTTLVAQRPIAEMLAIPQGGKE